MKVIYNKLEERVSYQNRPSLDFYYGIKMNYFRMADTNF